MNRDTRPDDNRKLNTSPGLSDFECPRSDAGGVPTFVRTRGTGPLLKFGLQYWIPPQDFLAAERSKVSPRFSVGEARPRTTTNV